MHVFGISAKVARWKMRGWTSRKHKEYWQSTHRQRQAKGFLKRPSAARAGELHSLSRNQPIINTDGSADRALLKNTLFKLGLVDIPGCDRCDQATETASQVLCHCEALAILRSRHLGCHFFKPNIFSNISVSKVIHIVHSAGC